MKKLIILGLLCISSARAQTTLPLTGVGYSVGTATPTLIQGPFMSSNDVASVSPMNTVALANNFMQTPLGTSTQTGNTIIAVVITASATSNITLSDDGSSSNTYTLQVNETAGSQTIAIYSAPVTHSSRNVKMTCTTDTGCNNNQMILWEYQNLGAVDVTCSGTATSLSAPGCGSSMTPTVNGDLILAAVSVVSFGTKPTGSMHFTAQAGASWNLATNDGTDWSAVQTEIQTTAAAITPAITTSSAVTRANAVGVAFKPTSSGGSAPGGPYLLSMQHQNDWGFSTAPTSTSETLYFPCPAGVTGTTLWLIVGNIDTTTVSAVTDSNSNTWTGLTRVDSAGDGFSIQWYHTGLNPTCSGSEAVTLTYGANPSALIPLWAFFVTTGASTGYDASATCGAGSTPCAINTSCASTTTVGGATITPSGYPALVLSYQNQDFDTISAVNVGRFLTPIENCPNSTGGCGNNGTGTTLSYVGAGLEQDAGIMADNLASGSAAISWTVANTQSTNVGPCFSSTVAIK